MSLTLLRVTQGKHGQAGLPLFEPCHSKEVPLAFFTQTVILRSSYAYATVQFPK